MAELSYSATEVTKRLKNNTKLYTDQEVRGKNAAGKTVYLDEDDGWG